MTVVRGCACGCRADLDGLGLKKSAKWASDACATAWTRRNPGKSKSEAVCPNIARTRRPSGLQVSFRRGVAAVRDHLTQRGVSLAEADRLAFDAMSAALSTRQRQRLEAMSR